MTAVEHLAWTRGQLRVVLELTFGRTSAGHPNTLAAAKALKVSRRSVQRWIAGDAGDTPHLSPSHWASVLGASRPDDDAMENERGALNYAHTAIEGINRRRHKNVLPAWKKQGWLDPHMVVILDFPQFGFRQVASAKVTSRGFSEVHRRGNLIEQRVVANKFAASILTYELLAAIDPWRLCVPADLVRQGRTWAWLADALAPTLNDLAVTNNLL